MTHAFLWLLHQNNVHWPLLLGNILFADFLDKDVLSFWSTTFLLSIFFLKKKIGTGLYLAKFWTLLAHS
jgi:hypothetical protein